MAKVNIIQFRFRALIYMLLAFFTAVGLIHNLVMK